MLQLEACYDTELYSFDIVSKQWTRLRLPGYVQTPRHSHTLNLCSGKLVVLGGSRYATGIEGFENKRDYAADVLGYDLNLSKTNLNVRKTCKKGKRKGKKKR